MIHECDKALVSKILTQESYLNVTESNIWFSGRKLETCYDI